MEETSPDEEVGVVKYHSNEDKDTSHSRGEGQLLARTDAAEEATTETTYEHESPVEGSQQGGVGETLVLCIEVDVVPYADLDTYVHEDSDDTKR